MNISGDLSISEYKPQTRVTEQPLSVSSLSGLIGKNSFMDLMKSLQGSAQKGLDETLSGIQSAFSKIETPEKKEETKEVPKEELESKETSSSTEISETAKKEDAAEEEEELDASEELSNVSVLPWFLVADAKSDETVDPKIETEILNELEAEIVAEASVSELDSKPLSTTDLVQTLFSKEESSELLNEAALEETIETSSLVQEELSDSPVKTLKENKIRSEQKEEVSLEKESKFFEPESRSVEQTSKDSKENVKNSSQKEISSKLSEESKIEVAKEQAVDSEKWKISRDKKTDSYLQLKTSGREEIKTAVLNQFSENSSGKSGQDQSSRGGSGDSYSSLVKGSSAPNVVGREMPGSAKDFSISKESHVLSKKDIQQNFQNLIRSARVQILDNGKTEASIRMNPKDLGQMSLSLSTDKDVVRGKLLVESDFIKQQLTAELANLKQELKANGLELESLVIEVKEREEAFAFNADSEKQKQDSHSFQTAFGDEWNSDFKNSSWEEDELSLEENSSEPHGFSEKTEGKTEKLLDLKV
ncbi:flagellar hook-length control protein FliK [Leptospira tipperaryensis]|uniref:Flagellar hook-length control protein FliK n=1 Tax=Leptospira tipperaryensis TaxID=2564040 RepID=A0A1D7V256_9LEPT|nr:flagellar hook-length control protein FliK [Leptospira tipperaryensis]AOP35924.1 flagellar hook-length control protein FliK [Leptospira tipperaryensis]